MDLKVYHMDSNPIEAAMKPCQTENKNSTVLRSSRGERPGNPTKVVRDVKEEQGFQKPWVYLPVK